MSRLSDYDYPLPENLIAQTPLEERTASRLLRLDRLTGQVEDRKFRDLSQILQAGDLLVLNDTRVTALRLMGSKSTGAAVEALLVQECAPLQYKALMRPAKRLPIGSQIQFDGGLRATVSQALEVGHRMLQFEDRPDFRERLREAGVIPLPPYIHSRLSDGERYQTVIARTGGSAAAPTAALHFTNEFLTELRGKGVEVATVTLDVGIDTFRPVQNDDLSEHIMHGERCAVPLETAAKIGECKGRIVAVGTTTVRTLETFAAGVRSIQPGTQVSKLFIQPGFKFRIVDGMVTNFHLPKTTMLIMISAMTSRVHVLNAYEHAVRERYRFLSFGDSMLIL